MYHVGSKDENPEKTLVWPTFFEHLLFEGTENIKEVNGLKL
jgi:predicted Zn-dependent peptidase